MKFQKDCAKGNFQKNEIQLLFANSDLLGSVVYNTVNTLAQKFAIFEIIIRKVIERGSLGILY